MAPYLLNPLVSHARGALELFFREVAQRWVPTF